MKVVTNQQHYYDIAEVIRAKTGITTPLKPAEMAPALAAMTPADALPHAEEFTFGANLALPEVPASVLAAYPKAVIFMVTSQESTQFVYIATTSAFYRVAGELLGMEYDLVVGSLGEGVKASDSGTGTWGDQFPVAAGTAGLMVGTEGSSTYSLVWANHDIYEVLAIDAATGTITTGAVYFAAANTTVTGTADDYRIQNDTLDSLGEEVNRLCNTVEPMAPERMTEKLQNLDITLEEIVVTPSTEEQEIRPSAYGFSKVIVEAVENSGTGGGGTPGEGGGEGDDEPEIKYPSFEDSPLTYEATTMEVPTGLYFYGSIDQALPPFPITYPYQVVYKDGVYYYVFQVNDFLFKGSSTLLCHSFGYKYTTHKYDANTSEWVQTANGTGSSSNRNTNIYLKNIKWANRDIYNELAGTTVYFTASSPEPEKVVTETYAPAATDAIYTVTGDTVTSLGATVYQITGEQATTPEAMIAALNYYAALNKPKEETTE